MLRRISVLILLILITSMTLFTLGIGVSHWEKLEIINMSVYTGFLGLTLIGVGYIGYDCLRVLRAYRRATERRFEQAGKTSRMELPLPALPKPELLDVAPETLEDVYVLFYPLEDKVED